MLKNSVTCNKFSLLGYKCQFIFINPLFSTVKLVSTKVQSTGIFLFFLAHVAVLSLYTNLIFLILPCKMIDGQIVSWIFSVRKTIDGFVFQFVESCWGPVAQRLHRRKLMISACLHFWQNILNKNRPMIEIKMENRTYRERKRKLIPWVNSFIIVKYFVASKIDMTLTSRTYGKIKGLCFDIKGNLSDRQVHLGRPGNA